MRFAQQILPLTVNEVAQKTRFFAKTEMMNLAGIIILGRTRNLKRAIFPSISCNISLVKKRTTARD